MTAPRRHLPNRRASETFSFTVAGKEGTRDDLKSGLNCEVTYAQGSAEPTAITCQ